MSESKYRAKGNATSPEVTRLIIFNILNKAVEDAENYHAMLTKTEPSNPALLELTAVVQGLNATIQDTVNTVKMIKDYKTYDC